MLSINATGEITEVLFKGNKSCKFMVRFDNKKLVATITNKRIELADRIEVGELYKIKGNVDAYFKDTDKGIFVDNVFYIDDLEKIEVQ